MEVIISKSVRKGRKKVYHTKKCIHTGRISEDNKVVTSESNAKKLGYTQCKCCSGLAGMLLENRSNIKRWKEKDGLRFNYAIRQQTLYVATNVGFWRISIQKGTKMLVLYHRNTYKPELTLSQAKAGRFHRQTELKLTDSFVKVINFIIEHDKAKHIIMDDYRKLPRHTKKQKKYYRYAEKREKQRAMKRLDELFEQIKTN